MSCTCVSFDGEIQLDKRFLGLAQIINVTLVHHNEIEILREISYLECNLKKPYYEFNGYNKAFKELEIDNWHILVNDTFFTKHFGFIVVKLIYFLLRVGYYKKNKVYGVVRCFTAKSYSLKYIQSFLFLYHSDVSDVFFDLMTSKFEASPILFPDRKSYLTKQEASKKFDQKSSVVPIEVELFLNQQQLIGRIFPCYGDVILIILAKVKRKISNL